MVWVKGGWDKQAFGGGRQRHLVHLKGPLTRPIIYCDHQQTVSP